MSNYIGNQPSAGEFKKLDSIASSFNGSLTQFDLDYNTVNQSVGDATQLIVSLNGIIQEPGAAYTLGIGGGSIVFASAPASTDTCHIVLLGGVGGTTTPTDGSVTASKLDVSLKDYLEETFTANGSQTDFTLTRAVVGANTLLVTIDGIVQPSSAFTASGTTLTISEVLAANTNVRVVHMGVKAGIYVPANDSVTTDMLANSINTDIASKLPLAGGTLTGNLGVTGTVTADAGSWSTVVSGNAITFDRNGENNIIADNGSSANLNLTAGNRIFYSADDYQSFKIGSSPTEKLRIRSTGIDVTGTVTAVQLDITAGTDAKIYTSNAIGEVGAGNFAIQSVNSAGSALKPLGFRAEDIRFATGPEERMRIDSSGNVGIGDNITKTWSLGKALHIGNAENSLWGEGDYAFHLVQNGYYNGGWKYTHSDAATMYSQSDGGQYWYHAGNGTADNALTWTPTMRLDTSGNLLVGRTSNLAGARTLISGTKSGTNGTNGQLVILDEQSYNTTDNGGGISFAGDFYNGGQVVFATIQGVKANNTDANNAGALKFTTKANGANQVEAMRIDSSGNLIVGNAGVSFTGDRLQVKSTASEPVASFYRPRNTAGGGLVRFMSDVGGTQTIVAQVTSEGTINLNGGVNFGSTGGSVTSKTLDDYEEGTWTPLFGDNSTTASSGGQFSATYVKIGKLVTVSADITTLTYSGANLNLMYGLPFAGGVSGVGNGGGGVGYTTTTNIVPGLHVTSNTSAIYFINLGTNVGGEILSISGKRFIFSLTYETS